MDEKTKALIDAMTYEDLLRKWRFAPLGDPMFVGETGKYFAERMEQKRTEEGTDRVAVSKKVGWGEIC